MPCPKKVQKKYKKGKIGTDKRRKTFPFRLSFIYLVNGLTNATSKDIAWCPKHQIVKTVLSVRRHDPKRGRFTENLSIYLSSPAPNSLRQNPSNFGATAFSMATLHFIIFLFSGFNRMDDVEPYAWRRIYTFRIRQPTSQHPVGSSLVIPKSPHISCLILINIQQISMNVNRFNFFLHREIQWHSFVLTVRHHFAKLQLSKIDHWLLAGRFNLYCHTTNICL